MAHSTDALDLTVEVLWVCQSEPLDYHGVVRVGPVGFAIVTTQQDLDVWPVKDELYDPEDVLNDPRDGLGEDMYPGFRNAGYRLTKPLCTKNYRGFVYGGIEEVFNGWDLDPLSAMLLTNVAEEWFETLPFPIDLPWGLPLLTNAVEIDTAFETSLTVLAESIRQSANG